MSKKILRQIAYGQRVSVEQLQAICDEVAWAQEDERRCELIASKIVKSITESELAELDALQHLADVRVRLLTPHPTEPLERLALAQFDKLLAAKAAEIDSLKEQLQAATLPPVACTPSLAARIFDAKAAECAIEQILWPDEEVPGQPAICPHFAHLSFDHYDRSIEIHCEDTTPESFAFTPEAAAIVFAMGFDCFWVNFPDGTEQFCEPNRIGKRLPVLHPRWTAETWREQKRISARVLERLRQDVHDQVMASVCARLKVWIADIRQSRFTGTEQQDGICNILTDVINHLAPTQPSSAARIANLEEGIAAERDRYRALSRLFGQSASVREQELLAENARLRDANRRLQEAAALDAQQDMDGYIQQEQI